MGALLIKDLFLNFFPSINNEIPEERKKKQKETKLQTQDTNQTIIRT